MEHIRKTNRKLGVGSRGVVYEGYDEESGRFVAVKEIPFFDNGLSVGNGDDEEEEEEISAVLKEGQAILREITLMERFEHPNLVAYYGARRSSVGVQIIMEFVNGGSLDALIRRHGSLRENVVRSYTHDILEGLAYLHDTARVCHRDVKPANVLITADGRCKLTDFGVSKFLDENVSMRTTVGTPWYMAPEVVNGNVDIEGDGGDYHDDDDDNSGGGYMKSSYTTAADIWSFGVTVFEMISGTKPFGNELKNPAAVLFAIASADGSPPRLPNDCEASPSLRNFLNLCFLRDTRLRPKARELLTHQWFLNGNTPVSLTSQRGVTHGCCCGGGMTGITTSCTKQVPLQSSLNMLDTADLIGDKVPLSTSTVSQRREFSGMLPGNSVAVMERRRSGSAGMTDGEVQGGFWSSDGHYVDLFLASPPMSLPLERKM